MPTVYGDRAQADRHLRRIPVAPHLIGCGLCELAISMKVSQVRALVMKAVLIHYCKSFVLGVDRTRENNLQQTIPNTNHKGRIR
jgi:hypothetical protein